MKEAVFIRQNLEKWKGYEKKLKAVERESPDTLSDIYIDVTNDLSFAHSHYPDSKITYYLNGLAGKLHQFINRRKKRSASRIRTFWTQEVPQAMYEARKELLVSFVVFILAVSLGAFSAATDVGYVRLILGDQYVDMTLENIAKGDPMGVYKKMDSDSMFWRIMLNNVRVSLITFVFGLFTSLGTVFVLLRNGVMVGSFQYFFIEQDLFRESALAIWLHGTLEMSELVMAGCAGIVMGNGWLFPGTYTRLQSFRRSALRGIKIIVGNIPIVILAAVIESYLTRYTEAPDWLRLLLIVASFSFVIFYYILYPRIITQKTKL
ncbi:stage II sporulation protein M [Bacteroidales bacterium OttesenSCG-928-A17]|nr:stage II sporulation protein M [Bacteroidales bacterium OttesenSCG-928-A17]